MSLKGLSWRQLCFLPWQCFCSWQSETESETWLKSWLTLEASHFFTGNSIVLHFRHLSVDSTKLIHSRFLLMFNFLLILSVSSQEKTHVSYLSDLDLWKILHLFFDLFLGTNVVIIKKRVITHELSHNKPEWWLVFRQSRHFIAFMLHTKRDHGLEVRRQSSQLTFVCSFSSLMTLQEDWLSIHGVDIKKRN